MWETVKLSEICEIQPQKKEVKSKLAKDADVTFMGMDLLGINKMYAESNQVRNLDAVYKSYTYFADNDVLLAKITPCFENGKLGIARELVNGVGFGSSEFIVFRCKNSLLPKYLYYFLNQNSFREEGKRNMSGAVGHKRVTKEFIANTLLLLPPLAEQQRIVAKLDAALVEIDKAIANTKNAIKAAYDGLANLIDDKTSNRDGWRELKVSDLGLVQTGNTPKTSDKENYGNDAPFVKPPHFNADGSVSIAKDGLSSKGVKQSRIAPKNSILMVCIGATIGKVGVCSDDVCFNQQINALTPSKEFDAELIYWQMRGRRFQSDVRAKAGQATLPIISKSKWQNLTIFVPAIYDEQVKIREMLRALSNLTEEYIERKKLKLSELSVLKSAILAQELQSEAA